MPEQFGDVVFAPHYLEVPEVPDQELLYSTHRFTQKGVLLEPGNGIIPIGAPLGQVTATKAWKVYASGASDGTEVCRGILRTSVDTGADSTALPKMGNIVISGILKLQLISSGSDGDAILSDLNGRADSVLKTFTF